LLSTEIFLKKSSLNKMSLLSGHQETLLHTGHDGLLYSNPLQMGNKRHREVNKTSVSPRATPPTSQLSSANSITFDLPHDAVDELEHAYLKFTLTNNNGAAAQLDVLDALTMIGYVEIKCNNKLVQVLYGDVLRKEFCLMLTDERQNVLDYYVGIDTSTYISDNAIADGSSRAFRAPINSMLNTCKAHLWRPKEQWRMVFHMRGGTDVLHSSSVATASDIGFSDCELILDGIKYDLIVRAQIDAALDQNADIVFKYVDHIQEEVSVGGSTTDGVLVNGNISSSGMCAVLFADLRSVNGTNETVYQGSSIDTFEILQNAQIVSHNDNANGYTYDDVRWNSSSHWSNPRLIQTLNNVYVSFSEDPSGAIAQGVNAGYFKLDGSGTRVRMTPGATIANAHLVCWLLCYSTFRINYGTNEIVIDRHSVDLE
jgi:hypothetical protein